MDEFCARFQRRRRSEPRRARGRVPIRSRRIRAVARVVIARVFVSTSSSPSKTSLHKKPSRSHSRRGCYPSNEPFEPKCVRLAFFNFQSCFQTDRRTDGRTDGTNADGTNERTRPRRVARLARARASREPNAFHPSIHPSIHPSAVEKIKMIFDSIRDATRARTRVRAAARRT